VYPTLTAGESPDYGEGWYFDWVKRYSSTHAEASQKALAAILQTYFPDGRP
jgi:hypothetical protein